MSTPGSDHPAPEKAPYQPPRLERFGAAAELTQVRSMIGQMDGGAGQMSRTG